MRMPSGTLVARGTGLIVAAGTAAGLILTVVTVVAVPVAAAAAAVSSPGGRDPVVRPGFGAEDVVQFRFAPELPPQEAGRLAADIARGAGLEVLGVEVEAGSPGGTRSVEVSTSFGTPTGFLSRRLDPAVLRALRRTAGDPVIEVGRGVRVAGGRVRSVGGSVVEKRVRVLSDQPVEVRVPPAQLAAYAAFVVALVAGPYFLFGRFVRRLVDAASDHDAKVGRLRLALTSALLIPLLGLPLLVLLGFWRLPGYVAAEAAPAWFGSSGAALVLDQLVLTMVLAAAVLAAILPVRAAYPRLRPVTGGHRGTGREVALLAGVALVPPALWLLLVGTPIGSLVG
jgi:hypothetical protein